MRRITLSLAALLLTLPMQAQQVPPSRRGVILGFDPLVYSTLSSEAITGGRMVGGTGIALRFGWGFTDTWSLVMDVAVTDLIVADTAEYLLAHGDVLLRATPLAWPTRIGTVVPVLQAGVSLRDVTAEGASPTNTGIYMFDGSVLSLGAGAELYFTETIAAWLGVYYTTGEFDDERIGNTTTHSRNEPGNSMRVGLGLTLHGRPKDKPR